MGRRALLTNGLVIAFKQLGDLKERAEFVSTTTSAFDPVSLAVVETSTSVFGYVVPFEKKTDAAKGAPTTRLNLLVRSRDVPSLAPFAYLRFRGKVWRIGTILVDSGYVLQFEVYLE